MFQLALVENPNVGAKSTGAQLIYFLRWFMEFPFETDCLLMTDDVSHITRHAREGTELCLRDMRDHGAVLVMVNTSVTQGCSQNFCNYIQPLAVSRFQRTLEELTAVVYTRGWSSVWHALCSGHNLERQLDFDVSPALPPAPAPVVDEVPETDPLAESEAGLARLSFDSHPSPPGVVRQAPVPVEPSSPVDGLRPAGHVSLESTDGDVTQLPPGWRPGSGHTPKGSDGPTVAVPTSATSTPTYKRRRLNESGMSGSSGSMRTGSFASCSSMSPSVARISARIPLRVDPIESEQSTWPGRPRETTPGGRLLASRTPCREPSPVAEDATLGMDVQPTEPTVELLDDLDGVSVAQTALVEEIRALAAALRAGATPLASGRSVSAPLSDVVAAVTSSARSLEMPGLVRLPRFDSALEPQARDQLLPQPITCEMHMQPARTCCVCLTIQAERSLTELPEGSPGDQPLPVRSVADSGAHHRELFPRLEVSTQELYSRIATPGVREVVSEHTPLIAKSIAAGHQRRLHTLMVIHDVFFDERLGPPPACRVFTEPSSIECLVREVVSLYHKIGISLARITHCNDDQLVALCCPEPHVVMPSYDDTFIHLRRTTHHVFIVAGDCIAVVREHHGLGSVTDHLRLADGLPVHVDGADGRGFTRRLGPLDRMASHAGRASLCGTCVLSRAPSLLEHERGPSH